jgi:glycosyltransferase involved in cell wall biosynthesis
MSRQPTIAHLNFASSIRGGEIQTLLLATYFASRGYHQIIGLRESNSELIKKFQALENVEVIALKSPYIFDVSRFKAAQFIYAHEPKGAQLAWLSHLLYGTRYSITKRVDTAIRDNWFNRHIYGAAYRVIAISSAVKRRILALSPTLKTEVIPSVYREQSVEEDVIEGLKERFKGKFVIAQIAALDPKKMQRVIIDVAKEIGKNHPEITFLFLGDGADREALEAYAEGLSNVEFEGFVHNVANYIEACDLFVFPTLTEGFGSTILDTSARSKVTIASNVGGIPDQLTHGVNGILIDGFEVEEWRDAILNLYGDRVKLEQLSKAAYESAKTFNVENMGRAYEALL